MSSMELPSPATDAYVEKRSILGRVSRESIDTPKKVTKTPAKKGKESSITGELWKRTPNKTKVVGVVAVGAVVAGVGVHKWIWAGDIAPESDVCTSPTQQQIVVDKPEGIRLPLRKVYEALPGWESPIKENGVYPTTIGGLVKTLESQRGYIISDKQLISRNKDLKGSEQKSLFSYSDEGKLSGTFENNGVYCLDVPAPIRSGTHLITEKDTSLKDISVGYKVPIEQLHQLNPDLNELKDDADLPEGAIIATSAKQGDLVLQEADSQAMNDYLTLPNGRFDERQWKRVSWENRAYSGITAIEPNDDLMFMPYDPEASKRLDGDTLPVSESSLFEQHPEISPETILAANPRTPIGIPEFQPPSRSGKREALSPSQGSERRDGPGSAGNEKLISIEHTRVMENDLIKFGVPKKFVGYYMEYSAMYGISPFLLAAKDKQESNWNPNAVSPVGAKGLGQAMPGTWNDYKVVGVIPKDADPHDPKWNIKGNAWYLRHLLDRSESSGIAGSSVKLALAAYNAGPGNVFNKYRGIPPFTETRNYVQRITSTMQDWGKTEVYYNDILEKYVKPANYVDVVKVPDNPVERRAYYAQKLGIGMDDIKFSAPNGIYQFDIDPRVAEEKLGIELYGGYPEKWRQLPLDGAVDDWNMFTRQCVSYAAWRVENDEHPGDMPKWGGRDNQPDAAGSQSGDAHFWIGNAKEAGIPVDKQPTVGSVAVWNKNGVEHNWKGHAAVVEMVLEDSTVIVSQYNNEGKADYTVEILSPQNLKMVSEQLRFIHFEKGVGKGQ